MAFPIHRIDIRLPTAKKFDKGNSYQRPLHIHQIWYKFFTEMVLMGKLLKYNQNVYTHFGELIFKLDPSTDFRA